MGTSLESAKATTSVPRAPERALVEALRKKRNSWSYSRGMIFPKVIFSNATIQNIVEAMPTSDGELLAVKGIGKILGEVYGPRILEMVRQHLTPEQRIARIRLLFPHGR